MTHQLRADRPDRPGLMVVSEEHNIFSDVVDMGKYGNTRNTLEYF